MKKGGRLLPIRRRCREIYGHLQYDLGNVSLKLEAYLPKVLCSAACQCAGVTPLKLQLADPSSSNSQA